MLLPGDVGEIGLLSLDFSFDDRGVISWDLLDFATEVALGLEYDWGSWWGNGSKGKESSR